MANDFRITLTVSGPKKDLDRFMEAHLGTFATETGLPLPVFDFSTVTPVPDPLVMDRHPTDMDGYDLYFGDFASSDKARNALASHFAGISALSIEEFRDALKLKAPELFDRARVIHENIATYGLADDTKWKANYWGSGNAIDTRVEREEETLLIYFRTEDAIPVPLLETLSSRYPACRFDLEFFETIDLIEGRVSAFRGTIQADAEE